MEVDVLELKEDVARLAADLQLREQPESEEITIEMDRASEVRHADADMGDSLNGHGYRPVH